MTIFGWLICASWLVLVAYWCISAAAAVRSVGSRWIWWREIALRLGFFALVVLILQIEVVMHVVPNQGLYILNTSVLLGLSGFVLSILGVSLAIAARTFLGSGWGTPTSSREQRELVIAGPYALVRHPMYGGLLLAMLGSAIGQSMLWLLPLTVYGPRFFASARREENLLIEQYPGRYRGYMSRTKMFVPFII